MAMVSLWRWCRLWLVGLSVGSCVLPRGGRFGRDDGQRHVVGLLARALERGDCLPEVVAELLRRIAQASLGGRAEAVPAEPHAGGVAHVGGPIGIEQ